VLDVMPPGLDGFAVCAALRAEGGRVPIRGTGYRLTP
jgi:DNA-binding response OmpR family regulator